MNPRSIRYLHTRTGKYYKWLDKVWYSWEGTVEKWKPCVDMPNTDHLKRTPHPLDPPGKFMDHEIAETVNKLRDIAIKYHDAEYLREKIAKVVVPIMKRVIL